MIPAWRVLLDRISATDAERQNVEEAAHAMIRFEQASAIARERGPDGRFGAVPYTGETGEAILNRTDPDIPRWCALATCAIRRADEIRGHPVGRTRNERLRGVYTDRLRDFLHQNAERGVVRLTMKGAAAQLGCSGETVFRSLRKLEAAGEIAHLSGPRRGAHGHFKPDVWRIVG